MSNVRGELGLYLDTAKGCYRELTDYYAHLSSVTPRFTVGDRTPVARHVLPDGTELDVVTVKFRDGYETASLQMADGTYVRPGTAYEARAVVMCLRHLLHRLRHRPDLVKSSLASYLYNLYGPGTLSDYRFMLDYVASVWGFAGIDDAIRVLEPVEVLDRVLADVGMLAWWTMGAPDVGQRLLAALECYQRISPSKRAESTTYGGHGPDRRVAGRRHRLRFMVRSSPLRRRRDRRTVGPACDRSWSDPRPGPTAGRLPRR